MGVLLTTAMGMGHDRIMVTPMDMVAARTLVEAPLLVRTTAAAAPMLPPTPRALALFCPPFSAPSFLAIKQDLKLLFTTLITGTQRGPWHTTLEASLGNLTGQGTGEVPVVKFFGRT